MSTFAWVTTVTVIVTVLLTWFYEVKLHHAHRALESALATAHDNARKHEGLYSNYERLLRIHEEVVSEHAECPTHIEVEALKRERDGILDDFAGLAIEHESCPVPYAIVRDPAEAMVVDLDEWRGGKHSHEVSDYDWPLPFNLVDHTGMAD